MYHTLDTVCTDDLDQFVLDLTPFSLSRIKSILKKRPSATVGSTDDELEAVASAVDANTTVDLVTAPPMPTQDQSGMDETYIGVSYAVVIFLQIISNFRSSQSKSDVQGCYVCTWNWSLLGFWLFQPHSSNAARHLDNMVEQWTSKSKSKPLIS